MCALYQSAIIYSHSRIPSLDTHSISGKLRRSRALFNLTLEELSKLTGISTPTLHEIETNRNNSISRPSLHKLVKIFPEELILTDYYKFIYHQSTYLKEIDVLYLSKLFDVNPSTIKRWQREVYIVKYEYYLKMKELGLVP